MIFLELALIRWLPAQVLSLAYFSNIVLIGAFLGFGMGCLMSTRFDLFRWFPALLIAGLIVFAGFRYFQVDIPPPTAEWIWSGYSGNRLTSPKFSLGILPTLAVVFGITAILLLPIGQKVGALMNEFAPTRAYSLNLLGSLAAILSFGALSHLGNRLGHPAVWFAVIAMLSVWFFSGSKRGLGYALALGGASCLLVATVSRGEIWSPYYSIRTLSGSTPGFSLYVNNFFHQRALDFKAEPVAQEKYSIPYQMKVPRNLLVLGAGTGNDVAAALDAGATAIDAVEIDPVIAELGRNHHPARPYQNAGVRLIIDDARSYLKKTDRKYDMIVFGTLDSHALLAAMSTVRLDNFVYTVESLTGVRNHLTDDGLAVLMFSVPLPWIGDKLLGLCRTVFTDPPPVAYIGDSYLFNLMILAGPGLTDALARYPGDRSKIHTFEGMPQVKNIPTDNWPYLYLKDRAIPIHYLKAIGLLGLLSILVIILIGRTGGGRFNLNFFCLGCAFMLLEAKSVTSLSILFGSTWVVNLYVLASILTLVLVANLLVARFRLGRIEWYYAGLGIALAFNYLAAPDRFPSIPWMPALLPTLAAALPLFFSGVIFARAFAREANPRAAFGANLMGSALGGFLEYASMAIGLNNLHILAGFFYLLSFASFKSLMPKRPS